MPFFPSNYERPRMPGHKILTFSSDDLTLLMTFGQASDFEMYRGMLV